VSIATCGVAWFPLSVSLNCTCDGVCVACLCIRDTGKFSVTVRSYEVRLETASNFSQPLLPHRFFTTSQPKAAALQVQVLETQ